MLPLFAGMSISSYICLQKSSNDDASFFLRQKNMRMGDSDGETREICGNLGIKSGRMIRKSEIR